MATHESSATVTRRDALKIGTGAGFAALLLAGSGNLVLAQEATPTPGQEGRYVSVRSRKLKADANPDDLIALVREGFVPLIQAIPGFVAYYVVADPDTRDQVGISIFADKAGADESTRIAAEWGPTSGATELVEGDPMVAEGVIAIAVDPA